MKAWISKYALTKGVYEAEGKLCGDPDETKYFHAGFIFERMHVNAHETREDAITAAEAMRKRKIASLRKQIARLEKLTFTGEPCKSAPMRRRER